ncbi:hypothetical protein ASG22_12590 [Chryseobacterium sp. Leaf405]|nr:hypothetical protein ASG22_12590 [Chryseobacterium sp. Leaf405]
MIKYGRTHDLFLFEAFSRFPLYLFGCGRSEAEPATKKDVVSIGANDNIYFKKFISLQNLLDLTGCAF